MSSVAAGARRARRRFAELEVSRDPLRLMVAALIFLTVSRAHQHFAWIGALQPLELLFLGSAGYAVFGDRAVSLENLTSYWPPRVVMGLGAVAALSVPFAISAPAAGSFFINAYLKVLLVFFLTVVAVRHPGDLKLFVWSYVLACGFLVFLSVFVFGLSQSGGMARLGGLYTYDSNGLGLVLSTGLPLCVVLFQNSGRHGKIAAALILLGIGVSLARSGSRGGFLGLLAVGIMLLIVVRGVSVAKRVGFVGVVVAGLFLASPQGYWEQMQTLTEPTEDYNWTSPYGRKAVAERGLSYMLDNPATGVGVGNFPRAEGVLSEIAQQRQATGQGYRWTAAHNSWVQVAGELGIPGLVLFCALVFGSTIGMYRLRKRLPRGWRSAGGKPGFLYDLALYLPASLVGFAVTCTFLSFAYHDIIYMLTVFVTGTYVGVRQIARRQAGSRAAGGGRSPSLRRAS
mgnify:CR=1 FL=1